MPTTAWPFIELDDRGVPFIQGTRIKVLMLARQHRAYLWDAEQIQRQYPQLSLPRIHAALGYYHEHRDECDRMIAQVEREEERMRRNLENPELQDRLRRVKEGA